MRFIHTHPDWPGFLWDADALSGPLAAVRFRQGRLLGRMDALEPALKLQASRIALACEAVSSAAIDGLELHPDQVAVALEAHQRSAPERPQIGSNTEGTVAMLLDVTDAHEKTLTRQRLLEWHEGLHPSGHIGSIRINAGAWRSARSDPMRVTSGTSRHERIHFQAPNADRVEREVEAFLEWFNGPPAIDPILVAGTAQLWFLTIRPFECSNGVVARAITQMALTRADGTRYCSYALCRAMHRERDAYLQQLEAAQRGDLNISAWLEWLIRCLNSAITDSGPLLQKVWRRATLSQRAYQYCLNERQRRMLLHLSVASKEVLTNSKYAALAKCSPDTALRDIRQLLAWGLLTTNAGGGRSTSYRLA